MSSARRRFRFIKEIAEGGFGKVYLAELLSADGFSRIVAVKLLHAKWSSHDEVVKRTRDEARLLGLIRHQHIVKVEDLTSIDGKCALVMEYLEGVDLKWMMQFLRKRGEHFPRNALFEIVLGTCSALDAAYNGRPLQGGEPLRVIHRDIKPSNIFVTINGGVKVLDFGTARANFAEREAKTMALAFGSQGYMAPERMLGEDDTPSADVFSLGVTIVELLTSKSFGRIPPRPNKFKAKIEEKLKEIQLGGDPAWDHQVRATIASMLAYEPEQRPTAGSLIEVFENLSADAQDMGLRRFCRTLVAEAKANLPDLESGDPLTGNVLDEDLSSAFGLGSGGVPAPAPPSPPSIAAAFGQNKPVTAAPLSPIEPPGPAQTGTAPTVSNRKPALPTIAPADLDTAAPASSSRVWVWVALTVVLFLGMTLVALGGVVWFVYGGGGGSAVPSMPTPVAASPAPEPASAEPPSAVADTPCQVVKEGSKASEVELVLTVNPPGAAVVLTQSLGYKMSWESGLGECRVKAPVGNMRAQVTPSGQGKIRGTSFELTGSQCSFVFEVGDKAWTGACQ